MTKSEKRQISREDDSATPQYGSQEYWDERYKKFRKVETAGDEKAEILNDDDILPNHAWYFTYQELRPLLLPLILGGSNEVMAAIMESNCIDQNGVSKGEAGVRLHSSDDPSTMKADQLFREQKVSSGVDEKDEQDCEVVKDEEADIDDEEVDDDEDENRDHVVYEEDDDEDDDDEPPDRVGIASNGPISVIEIGCGDVPLGDSLAQEILDLEGKNGAKAGHIVSKIICTDYSPSCIQALKSNRLKREEGKQTKTIVKNSGHQNHDEVENPMVQYVVVDAREMKYPDESFELILEKGTLDSMLSDNELGVRSCIEIVAECARILKVGGYFVLVSHLNAHTTKGLEWLEGVIVKGLRAGGGTFLWEIEVHGNDGENEESPNTPVCNPGPAVYIIGKKPKPEPNLDDDDHPPERFPLRFFSY
jgi:SAM-dependent methyltransferase